MSNGSRNDTLSLENDKFSVGVYHYRRKSGNAIWT